MMLTCYYNLLRRVSYLHFAMMTGHLRSRAVAYAFDCRHRNMLMAIVLVMMTVMMIVMMIAMVMTTAMMPVMAIGDDCCTVMIVVMVDGHSFDDESSDLGVGCVVATAVCVFASCSLFVRPLPHQHGHHHHEACCCYCCRMI